MEAVGLESLADGADTAVHHVRGRHHVGARRRMGQRLLHQHVGGDVVEHVTRGVDDAVLAVGGVGVQSDVCHHAQLRHRVFQRPDGALHQAVGAERLLGQQALALGPDDREQCHGGNAQLLQFPRLLHQPVDAEALDARHGRDGFASVVALQYEHRENEVGWSETRLAHQGAGKAAGAQAPHPGVGKGAALGAECHLLFLAQRPAMAVAAASTESEMSRSLWALDMKPAS